MKLAFAAVLAVHGVIHLLGFAKAFEVGRIPALSLSISKTAGVLWALTALLWIAAAGLLVATHTRWWIPAAVALALSQGLVAASWRDARFGTIPNAIALGPVLVAALLSGPTGWRAAFDRHVAAAGPTTEAIRTLTEQDLVHLPAPVRAYLRYTGAVGRPLVRNYRLQFVGAIREAATSAWMTSAADQFSDVTPASRWFFMTGTRSGVPFEALHVYEGAHATFRVRVAGLKTVIDARGPEMDQSETVTLFNDMCLLAPATLIDRGIAWQLVDDRTVHATFGNAGHTIGADLIFDAEGALRHFSSDDRYRLEGGVFVRRRWTTPVTAYGLFDGRRVVADAEARWTLPEGEFAYARLTTVGVGYNSSPARAHEPPGPETP